MMLVGKQIKLRAIEEEEYDLIARWRNDPENTDDFFENRPFSKKENRLWFERHISDPSDLYLMIASLDDNPIGTIALVNIDLRNGNAEYGRLLIGDPKYRGKKLGFEAELLILEYAFEHLNLHKVYGYCRASNTAVLNLHRKTGFEEEAVLKEHMFNNGEFGDVIVVAYLKDDFLEKKTELFALRDEMFSR